MEIYQCMTCGEKWPHEGLERNMDIATQHQSRGHIVKVGNIDKLAKEYRKVRKERVVIVANDSTDPRPEPVAVVT